MGQADEFVLGIFVGAFRPDRFVFFELNGDGSFRDGDGLTGAGAKVHFDAVRCCIEESRVRELPEIEIGAEFAIDAGEKIEIEGGGDTDGIVVGAEQRLNGLEHVRAEEKRVTGQKNLADAAEKIRTGGAVKVADVAAEEENEKMFAGGTAGGDFAKSVEIFALEADDADAVDVAKLAAKNGKRGRRNFDGVIPGGLPAGKGFEEQAGFAAGAAAELGDDNGARELVDDFPGVQLEQMFFGAGQAVLGELADDFEERGADGIIKIF